MEFTYRKFEVFGRVFFRILSRTDRSDVWRVCTKTIDWDSEDWAAREVQRLAKENPFGRVVIDVPGGQWNHAGGR
jgi:hypothetical protein